MSNIKTIALRNIMVNDYNVLQTDWLISPTPIVAINMFVHNLYLKTLSHNNTIAGVYIIHHNYNYNLAKNRYNILPAGNTGFAETKSTYEPTSSQPNVTGNMEISIIIDINENEYIAISELEERLVKFMHSGRIAGGKIKHYNIDFMTPNDKLTEYFNSGFFVNDVSYLLEGNNKIETMMGYMENYYDNIKYNGKYYTPSVLGYHAITEFKNKHDVRNNKQHAFVEPLTGLIEYVKIRNLSDNDNIIPWQHKFTDDKLFVCYQQKIEEPNEL